MPRVPVSVVDSGQEYSPFSMCVQEVASPFWAKAPAFLESRTSACEIVSAVSAVAPSVASTNGPRTRVTPVLCFRKPPIAISSPHPMELISPRPRHVVTPPAGHELHLDLQILRRAGEVG